MERNQPYEMKTLLVTVKTYPTLNISKPLVSGITDDRHWIRLHPVDFRYFPGAQNSTLWAHLFSIMLIIPEEPYQDSIGEIILVHCGTSITCTFGMGTGVSSRGAR